MPRNIMAAKNLQSEKWLYGGDLSLPLCECVSVKLGWFLCLVSVKCRLIFLTARRSPEAHILSTHV